MWRVRPMPAADISPDEQVRRLADWDAGMLLHASLNAVSLRLATGERERGIRWLTQWHRALQLPLGEAPAIPRALREMFSAENEWRRSSLAQLGLAIERERPDRFARWSWAGGSYGAALRRLQVLAHAWDEIRWPTAWSDQDRVTALRAGSGRAAAKVSRLRARQQPWSAPKELAGYPVRSTRELEQTVHRLEGDLGGLDRSILRPR